MKGQLLLVAAVSVLATSCASTRDEIHVDEDFFVEAVEADRLTGVSDPALPDDLALASEATLASEAALSDELGSTGVPMTEDEMNEVLVGNTYPLDNGDIYFHSDNIATIYRDGESQQTDWWQSEGGEFCHGVKLAGGVEECVGLFRHDGGDFVHSYDGTTRIIQQHEIFPGNKFD